jgi:hypothetical protein
MSVLTSTRFFCVAKSEDASRSILNCRELSQNSHLLGPVCLLPIHYLLVLFADLLRRFPQLVVCLLDFRHFFHQVPIDPETSKFFATSACGSYFRWRVLPMGHTGSPRLAQVISWLLLEKIGVTFEASKNPPNLGWFNVTPEVYAAVTVWYDNVIIMGHPTAVSRLREALLVCCARYHVVTKYARTYSKQQLSTAEPKPEAAEEEQFPVTLGLRLAVLRTKGSTAVALSRHPRKKIETWSERLLTLRASSSLKSFAIVLGFLIWDGYTSGGRTIDPSLIAIARRVGAQAPRPGGSWHILPRWPKAHLDWIHLLHRTQRIMDCNPWREVRPPPLLRLYFASDASSHGGGFVIFDSNTRLANVVSWRWTGVLSTVHISVKEALAYLYAFRFLCRRHQDVTVIGAVDAAAVAGAITRGYSGSINLQGIIRRIQYWEDRTRNRQFPCLIPGVSNVADVPSRRKCSLVDFENPSSDEALRLHMTVTALKDFSLPSDAGLLAGDESDLGRDIFEEACEIDGPPS